MNDNVAGERSLVKLLAISGFNASRWLIKKLMRQEGLINRQFPITQYAKSEKKHLPPQRAQSKF